MARRGRTVIGGDSARSAAANRQAESAGSAERQRAEAQVLQQQRAGAANANQMAGIGAQAGAGADRQRLAEAELEQRGEQFEKRLQLDEYRAGAERVPNDRAQQLEQEMARGGQQTQGLHGPPLPPEQQEGIRDQASRGMQTDDGYTYRPRADVREAQRSKQELEAYKAQTERIRARAYDQQVAQRYIRARQSGDKDAAKKEYDNMVKPLRSTIDRVDRMVSGNIKDGDWRETKNMVLSTANPERHGDVIEDVKAERWTPRVQKFIQARVAENAMNVIVNSQGTFPVDDQGNPLFDMESPAFQAFMQQRHEEQQRLGWVAQNAPGFGQFYGLTSLDAKNRALNFIAASIIKSGARRVGDPMGGMQPGTTPQEGGGGMAAGPQQTQEQYDAEVGRYDPQSTPDDPNYVPGYMTPEGAEFERQRRAQQQQQQPPPPTGARARWDQLEGGR